MRIRTVSALALALAAAAAAVGCKSSESPAPAASADKPATTAAPAAPSAPGAAAPTAAKSPLSDPSLKDTAPAVFKAKFETTKGAFTVEVHRDWAPNGADRFYHLVKIGYFDEVAFFRNIKGFMVQFGIHGDPSVSAAWRPSRFPDDPATGHSNTRGMLTFATAGPNSRTTQLFINHGNNAQLDGMGFTPIGKVTDGMDVVDALETKYGEGAPAGLGPMQGRLQAEGNSYLRSDFPALDYVKKATLVD